MYIVRKYRLFLHRVCKLVVYDYHRLSTAVLKEYTVRKYTVYQLPSTYCACETRGIHATAQQRNVLATESRSHAFS